MANKDRKFVIVELKFFQMWYEHASNTAYYNVQNLVRRGQLEFANAGWSMHDEACPTYEQMIDNHLKGMQWLNKEFGVRPRVGWQIDTFGHSNTNARLFS
mmetsp:Transcript_6779/g.10907  ORF Transcript_6779/g.10907 Transcript_6779/m.10907 type:complete len:100 (+) Transcript_6779:219-518(+)